jgi:hypothetical protein
MRAILVVVVALMALAAKAEDMQKYLGDTQDLVRQGKHQEALERFVWFHEHALENDPGMYGVRLSFALSYWKSLGDVFPPAQTALVELRDRTLEQVTDKGENVPVFHDLVSLNRTLGEDSKTVELFQTIDQTKPELAKKYWNMAKDAVIAAKRYDLAGKYIGSPTKEFTRIKAMYDLNTTYYDKPNFEGAEFKNHNENHFVEESLQLIAIVLARGDPKAAKQVQEKAQAVVDDRRLREAIPAAPAKDAQ